MSASFWVRPILIEGRNSHPTLHIVLFTVLPYLIKKTQSMKALSFISVATQHHTWLSQPDFSFPRPLRLLQLNYPMSSWVASVQQESSAHRKAWETDCFLTRGCFCQHINQPLRGIAVLVQGRVPKLERRDNCSKPGWGKQGAEKSPWTQNFTVLKISRCFLW